MKDICSTVTDPGINKVCKGCEFRLKCLVAPDEHLPYHIRKVVAEELNGVIGHTVNLDRVKVITQCTLQQMLNEGNIQAFRDLRVTQEGSSITVSATIRPTYLLNELQFEWGNK